MIDNFVFAPGENSHPLSVTAWLAAHDVLAGQPFLRQARTAALECDAASIFIESDWKIVVHTRESDGDVQVFARCREATAWLVHSMTSRTVTIWVSSRHEMWADRWVEKLKSRFTAPPLIEDTVSLRFWAQTDNGPRAWVREIAAPTWKSLDGNYAQSATLKVGQLMELTPPISAGQLILWHGPPGTGKTHAIRALCREWLPWCDAHYVVDPDRFFGEGAYMLHVILESGNDDHPRLVHSTQGPLDDEQPIGRWQLLIIEDADELMSQDAKERTGQALSRLLNLCDGLIGQGLRTLVLITTNAPLMSVHPAVARPGRCLAEVEFGPLSDDEARAWLRVHDEPVADMRGSQSRTLSELYDSVRDQRHIGETKRRGSTGTYV